MNWTGGTLSRSRNANANVSISVKQKNHFAKARVKLQNRRQPPPEIQYFDFGEWKPESGVHDDRRSNPVRRKERASSQRTLDQFENVEGVVRKLKSLRPRDEARQKEERFPFNDGNEARKRRRSPIDDTEGHVLPSGIAIPPISPVPISSHLPSSTSPIQDEFTTKRTSKRLRASTPSTSDEPDPLALLDSVGSKRRKLLEENDWVGIERQRRMSTPIKMKFTDAKDRDLIGRRRPLNSGAVQNRWNVQGPRQMKVPLTASYSEKQPILSRPLADEYWSREDTMNIRIGSKGMTEGPISNELLDCYQSPGPSQSPVVQNFNYDNAGPTLKPQDQRREVTTSSAFKDGPSEPFHSLLSPEDVEQSGIAQLVEAATIADDDNHSLAEDELQLPEDYNFPEPEPGFRLAFEQTPQPRGQTSKLNDSSSPIVRDFAFVEGQPIGATVEESARPGNCSVFDEQIPEHAPVKDALPSTSPLSIATSRYMQELENKSLGSRGRGLVTKNMANCVATVRAQPTVNSNKTEASRETTGDRERTVSVQPDVIEGKENVQPTEDEDEIWRKFVDIDEFQSNQQQPTTKQIPHVAPRAPLVHEKQAPHQAPAESTTQKAPPPWSSRDDDELIWQNFIFSDSNPNDEWLIEEASPESPPGNHISPYDPARVQPSMIAEAATSPVKQNPHLMDEMLDDSMILDDASRYANVSMTSNWSPGSTENVSSMPQRVSNPSDSPSRSSSVLATASPATQRHSSNLPPPNPNPRLPNPSSLIAEASSSSIPTYLIQYLSPPTGATANNNNNINNPLIRRTTLDAIASVRCYKGKGRIQETISIRRRARKRPARARAPGEKNQ